MSERIWGTLRNNALYKSTYTLLYFVDVQTAVAKVQEMTTKAQENAGGKMTESDLLSMHSRADVVTYAVLAEVQHFEQYRIGNFRDYMTRYLQGQIEFYRTASSSRSFQLTCVSFPLFSCIAALCGPWAVSKWVSV